MLDPDELALLRADARLERQRRNRSINHQHPGDPCNPAWDYDDDEEDDDQSIGDASDGTGDPR